MSGGILPTSDDVRPTAKVGGEPPGRVWGLASPGHPVDRTVSVGVASWPAQFFLSAGFGEPGAHRLRPFDVSGRGRLNRKKICVFE